MKIVSELVTALALAVPIMGHFPSSNKELDRRLDGDYAFIASQRGSEWWCLAATRGVDDFRNLGIRPCDFSTGLLKDLWRMDSDGKIHSALDPDQCITVNFGTSLRNQVRVRIASCSLETELNKFAYDNGMLKVLGNDEYCLTNRGDNPNPGDYIRMLRCASRKKERFLWTFQPRDVPDEFPTQIVHEWFSGQIEVKDRNVGIGDGLVMGTSFLDIGDMWSFDEYGLFHIFFDHDLCMQAGLGGYPVDGTKIRLAMCDRNNKLQTFEWDMWGGPIKLKNRDGLCVTFRGVEANVNDPIILKECDKIGGRAGWYED